MQYREAILTVINARNGITSVDLVLTVMGYINPVRFSMGNYINTMVELRIEGLFLELEYTLPSGREMRLYFPKGTTLGGETKSQTSLSTDEKGIGV